MDVKFIRTGLFEIQMCCSADCTDDFIKRQATLQDGGKWSIADLGDSTYVACEEEPGRMHVVLNYLSSNVR